MEVSKNELKEKWMSIYNEKIDELREVLNKCGEYPTIIIRSHLFIEQVLEEIIKQELSNSSYVLKKCGLSFTQKLYLVRGLDQFEKEIYDPIKFLNNIRNNYVHDLNYELSEKEILSLGRTLGKVQFDELKEFSDSQMHLLVLVVDEICRKALVIYSSMKVFSEKQIESSKKIDEFISPKLSKYLLTL